jgi:hypothetical protein
MSAGCEFPEYDHVTSFKSPAPNTLGLVHDVFMNHILHLITFPWYPPALSSDDLRSREASNKVRNTGYGKIKNHHDFHPLDSYPLQETILILSSRPHSRNTINHNNHPRIKASTKSALIIQHFASSLALSKLSSRVASQVTHSYPCYNRLHFSSSATFVGSVLSRTLYTKILGRCRSYQLLSVTSKTRCSTLGLSQDV